MLDFHLGKTIPSTLSILLKVLFYFWVLVLLFSSNSIFAQRDSESFYDIIIVSENLQSRKYINQLLESLEKTQRQSAKAAHYHNQLAWLYAEIGKPDSAQYYLDKANSYWLSTKVSEDNGDYFGQYLLRKVIFGPRLSKDVAMLDSASKYIQNPKDKIYIQALRWNKTPVFSQKESYTQQLEALLEQENLPKYLEGHILQNFVLDLLNTDYPDSAMKITERLESIPVTKYVETNFRYYRVYNYSKKRRIQEVIQELKRLENIVDANGLYTRHAVQYHSAKYLAFKLLKRYDSAAYHSLQIIEINVQRGVSRSGLAPYYTNIALVYRDNGDYENAIKYIFKSVESYNKNDYANLSRTLNTMIQILLDAYKLSEGEAAKENLLRQLKEVILMQEENIIEDNSPERKLRFEAFKGRFLLFNSDLRGAETRLKSTLTVSEQENFGIVVLYSKLFLAELSLRMKRFDDAISYALATLEYNALNEQNKIFMREVLIEAYTMKGKPKEALEQLDSLRVIRGKRYEERTAVLLAEFEVKQELETQKLLNENLEKEQLAKEELIKRQQIIIGVVSVSIIIILFVLLRIRSLQQKNLNLIAKIEKEGEELQATNLELGDTVSTLKAIELKNRKLLEELSVRLNKVFNSMKGLRSFIPEVGKLNTEQSRYFDRMTELMEEEEQSLNKLVVLNSVLGDHQIEIRRVSLVDTIKIVKDQLRTGLHLKKTTLDVEMNDGLVFLADRELIEMSIVSLVQHSLGQGLIDNKLMLSLNANDGLEMVFEFRAERASNEQIQAFLIPNKVSDNSYFNKLVQLKELMDGELQYLCIGDLHKITMKLNLIEIKQTESGSSGVRQLEIDKIYDQVMDYLVTDDALSNADLTLMHLSEALSLSTRKISFVVNTREKTNFSKFLAKLRIEKIKKVLDDGGHTHLNIAGIGYEAGFNSKSTFFSSFKEFVGCTPKEYITDNDEKISA